VHRVKIEIPGKLKADVLGLPAIIILSLAFVAGIGLFLLV
jgi:hypothetical protein